MWIVTNKGFMSIVAKDANGKPSGPGDDAVVSVRFRRPKDAAALFPDHEFVATPAGDYCGRIFATRMEVAVMLAKSALGLDYVNFKSSIKGDAALSTAAHSAWDVFGKLQDGGPYGRAQHAAYPSAGRSYQDDLFRSGASGRVKPPKLKAKEKRHPRNPRNPFCAGCGKRFDVENLNERGYCRDCDDFFPEPASAGSVAGFTPDLATGGGRCWNCETVAAERNRFKLCEDCAPLYDDVEDVALLSIAESVNE